MWRTSNAKLECGGEHRQVTQDTVTSRMMKILVVLLSLHFSSGFLITEAEPGLVRVAPGATVTLFCAVDDDYEWCKFYHPSGQECDFEWKRSKKNITMQDCDLSDRVGGIIFYCI